MSGAGDPRRSLELLWGTKEAPKRGPRQSLSVSRIGDVAIALADSEGLAALSMRRVAEELKVSAMSLYTYVPGKAELLDVMLDCAYGQLAPDPAPGGGWRKELESLARSIHALFVRHPWMLQVATHRPALGPHAMAMYERGLQAVSGTGLADLEMDMVVTMVADHVRGAARSTVDAALAHAETGQTDVQWWATYEEAFASVFDTERYPLAARVGRAAGEANQAPKNPQQSFEFGLGRLLDGLAVYMERQAAGVV